MAFIIICTYGSSQPHRSFMHSFLSLFMLTACIDVIYPDAAPYFAVAYASHLALDLLNYRRLRLIWPMKRGFSLGFCSSQGLINHLLMSAGMVRFLRVNCRFDEKLHSHSNIRLISNKTLSGVISLIEGQYIRLLLLS